MANEQSRAEILRTAEDRINWVLAHPDTSEWLKDALRAARDRNPVDVLNDLEMLNHLLRPPAESQTAS